MSKSLPPRPDLRWLRDEAKARRRAGEFPSLALAHLAIAHEYGFVSWPRLKAHIDALTLGAAERAVIVIASGCSDDPRRATTILELDPAIARHDLATACVAGEVDEVERLLHLRPDAAHEPVGPNGWQPLLYACFSRLSRTDPQRAAGIRSAVAALLAAGADPNASFTHGDWLQAPIYGAAGIAGDVELTKRLLAAGADPNDASPNHTVGEALYHACEHRDPTCARLLIEAGTDPEVVHYCLGRALNFKNHAMVAMFCATAPAPAQRICTRRSGAGTRSRRSLCCSTPAPRSPNPTSTGWRHCRSRCAGAKDRSPRCYANAAPANSPRRQRATPRSPALLDEMVILAIQRGDLAAVRGLLDAGARVEGNPDSDENPLGQACWRGQMAIAKELLAHGATTEFRDGGCAIGAALHGSRHCQDPEGGPTMATVTEIDPEPYTEIVRMLLATGARVPERVSGEHGPQAATLLGELGISPHELPGPV